MILACDIGSTHTKVALLRNPLEQRTAQALALGKEVLLPGVTGGPLVRLNGPCSDVLFASYRKYLPLEQQDGPSLRRLLFDIGEVLWHKRQTKGQRTSQQKGNGQIVEALSFSGHGPSLVAIDRDGQLIPSAYNPIDRSATGLEAFRCGSSFYLPLARALWMRLGPALRDKTVCMLPVTNYLVFLLTGKISVPIPADYASFYWPAAEEKSDDCHELDAGFLPLLPKLTDFCTAVGRVQAAALREFSLPQSVEGVPVFCPGVDFFAAEAGLCHGSSQKWLHNRTGTSEGFNLFLKKIYHPDKRKSGPIVLPPGYFISPHVTGRGLMLSYIQEGSGALFDWLFRLWQERDSGPVGRKSMVALDCASLERIQRSAMLQNILLNASRAELDRAEQFAKQFVKSRQPYCQFSSALSVFAGREVSDLPQLGLYLLHVLSDCFSHHSSTMFSLYKVCTGRNLERSVLVSGSQAGYPAWLEWKACRSQTKIYVPSVFDAEFLGAAAIGYSQLGYFSSLEAASKHLFCISRHYG